MMFTMNLVLRPEPGALLRVLGMVERRCFAIERVDARLDRQSDTVSVSLSVSGDRPASRLTTQLEKLYVVLQLETPASAKK